MSSRTCLTEAQRAIVAHVVEPLPALAYGLEQPRLLGAQLAQLLTGRILIRLKAMGNTCISRSQFPLLREDLRLAPAHVVKRLAVAAERGSERAARVGTTGVRFRHRARQARAS